MTKMVPKIDAKSRLRRGFVFGAFLEGPGRQIFPKSSKYQQNGSKMSQKGAKWRPKCIKKSMFGKGREKGGLGGVTPLSLGPFWMLNFDAEKTYEVNILAAVLDQLSRQSSLRACSTGAAAGRSRKAAAPAHKTLRPLKTLQSFVDVQLNQKCPGGSKISF